MELLTPFHVQMLDISLWEYCIFLSWKKSGEQKEGISQCCCSWYKGKALLERKILPYLLEVIKLGRHFVPTGA